MSLTRDQFAAWLDRYIEAWKSHDAAVVGDLFSADVNYSQNGGQTALDGREAVVADWLDEPYAPDAKWAASYEPLAIEGEVNVGIGSTRYFEEGGLVREEFSNIFVCRFDADGRCHELREWWMRAPGPVGRLD